MSFNSFRKEFIDPNSRSRSPTRHVDAIELIPESLLVRNIAELLKYPPPVDSSHRRPVYKQPALRTQRRKPPAKAGSTASKRAAPKGPRHSHSNSAGAPSTFHQPPPLSPIDTLASVATFEATSPHFHNDPPFYSPPRAGNRVQVSPISTTYPAPAWASTQYGDYNAAFDERPAKRARSEVAPSTYSANEDANRPATSYNIPLGWAHNLEQSIDSGQRMTGFSSTASNQHYGHHRPVGTEPQMADAELLLHFSTRGASGAPVNGGMRSPELARNSWQTTHRTTPSIPPFPYSAPQSSHDIQTHQDEDHDMLDLGAKSGAEHPRVGSQHSVQTHTPPEDVTAPIPQATEVGLTQEYLPPPQPPKPDGQQAVNVQGLMKPVESSTLIVDTIIQQAQMAPPKQLQSPQSLLAEPKDLPTSPIANDSASFATTGLLISTPQAISSPKPKDRRVSESHLLLTPDNPPHVDVDRQSSMPSDPPVASIPGGTVMPPDSTQPQVVSTSLSDTATRCASCNWAPNSISEDKVDWLKCDGCDNWYHFACAGFTIRDIRRIDKFYCRACKGKHGNTTFVRKSTRVHTTVDYAGLNEGVLRQSDDHPEHHYIEPIKNNKIQLVPETFPRMRPEDITADFFEKAMSFSEPILIPAHLNPRPHYPGQGPLHATRSQVPRAESDASESMPENVQPTPASDETTSGVFSVEDGIGDIPDDGDRYELVLDDGQDGLDMVIPQGLTVRRVANLYGAENHVPVIDVKSQEGDNKKWTVGKWADYYESTGDKVIRNVISLEVSRTPFGKLIRRPKVVRDLDLQDSVWPKNEARKSVGFYCLMSVADSYTDFHIDFGGSSVYYHILKGKKVFFFIPPTKSNLQKYEDWNTLPSQNWTWLPDQTKTKECFRVDLYPGDTMLIPSGWIHSVWTPEDSLVIGGNFLTRLHYGMQFRVAEIEKNNKTGLAFRYPKFQKVMWYTVLKYLEEDPLPGSVIEIFTQGKQFKRSTPAWQEFNKFGHNSDPGPPNYHARYYPKQELDGLPEMVSYIFRTVLIHLDCLEGISQATRKAVSDSIPKHSEPLEVARSFAMWVAWKRGNEDIPQWAHPESVLPTRSDGDAQKKLSIAQFKRLERAAAIPPPERQSARIKEISTTPKTSTLGPRRTACDACRKRKMRCKHIEVSGSGSPIPQESNNTSPLPGSSTLFGVVIPPPAGKSAGESSRPEHQELTTPVKLSNPPFGSIGILQSGITIAHSETTPDGKKGRTKACDECRRSKRRCVHDEFGNIDLVKKNEPPIPRGSAKRKVAGDVEMPNGKKPKREPAVAGSATMPDYSPDGAVQHALGQRGEMWSNSGTSSVPQALMGSADYNTASAYNERLAEVYSYNNATSQVFSSQTGIQDAPLPKPDSHQSKEQPENPSQSSGLQAIADAAMANTAESVLDPALFDAPTVQQPTEPQVNGIEPMIEQPVSDNTSAQSNTDIHEYMAIDSEILPEPTLDVVDNMDGRQMDAVPPVVPDINVESLFVEHKHLLGAPVEPEANVSEAVTAKDSLVGGEDVDLVDISTSDQAELGAENLVTPRDTKLDVQAALQPKEKDPVQGARQSSSAASALSDIPASIEGPTDSGAQEAPTTPAVGIDEPISRASSLLSEAPTEQLQNGIEATIEATIETVVKVPATKPKRTSARRSKGLVEAIENGVVSSTEPAVSKRHSSRHSKPIERLSTQQHAEQEAWSSKKIKKQAPLPNGHVVDPIKSTSPEIVRERQTPARTPAKTSAKTTFKAPAAKPISKRRSVKPEFEAEGPVETTSPTQLAVETEEEKDHILAMQLQREGLGLRARRDVS